MIRIYDAAFATTTGTQHQHLGTFWWVDDYGNKGQWSRLEAYNFVVSHSKGYVYVAEGGYRVTVWGYYNEATGTKWIQTQADGTTKDNLTELAERHRRGLPNR